MSTSAGHADAGYDRPYRDMATFARVTQWLLYASAAVSAAGFYFSGLGGDGSTLVASAPPAPIEAVVGLLEFPLWIANRSEEHTSELQSLMRISYAVFCLKKKKYTNHY